MENWECPLCGVALDRAESGQHLVGCSQKYPEKLEELQQQIWRSWLVEKVSFDKLELDYVKTESEIQLASKQGQIDSFWLLTEQQWIELQSFLRFGDQLWKFTSDNQSWEDQSGRLGWAVVRGNKIVGMMVTMLS